MTDHYTEAQQFVRLALGELDPTGQAIEVRRSFDAAKVHATLAVADQLALLAAWRADIDSEPHRSIQIDPADLTFDRESERSCTCIDTEDQ